MITQSVVPKENETRFDLTIDQLVDICSKDENTEGYSNYVTLTHELIAKGWMTEAVALAESLYKKLSRSVPVILYLAKIYASMGNQEASKLLRVATFVDPNNPEPMYRLRNDIINIFGGLRSPMIAKVTSLDYRRPVVDHSSDVNASGPGKFYVSVRYETRTPYQVFLTESVNPGTLVYSERPFAVAPDLTQATLHPLRICCHCLQEINKFVPSYTCPIQQGTCPYEFCSFDCLCNNIKIHEKECNFISQALFVLSKKNGIEPTIVLLFIRTLLRASLLLEIQPNHAPAFKSILSLNDYLFESQHIRQNHYKQIEAVIDDVVQCFPPESLCFFSPKELASLLSIIFHHSLPILVISDSASLLQLSPVACNARIMCGRLPNAVQHSCVHSCTASYNPKNACLSVCSPYILPAQTPLLINYRSDLLVPTSMYKSLSSVSWPVLMCHCKRCNNISEGGLYPRGYHCMRCIRGLVTCGMARDAEEVVSHLHRLSKIPSDSNGELYEILHEDENDDSWVERFKILHPGRPLPVKQERDSSGVRWYCSGCGVLSPQMVEYYMRLDARIYAAFDEISTLKIPDLLNSEEQSALILSASIKMFHTYQHLMNVSHHIRLLLLIQIGGLSLSLNTTSESASQMATLAEALWVLKMFQVTPSLDRIQLSHRLSRVLPNDGGINGKAKLNLLWHALFDCWMLYGISPMWFSIRKDIQLLMIMKGLIFFAPCNVSATPGNILSLSTLGRAIEGNDTLSLEQIQEKLVPALTLHFKAAMYDNLDCFRLLFRDLVTEENTREKMITSIFSTSSIAFDMKITDVMASFGAYKTLKWLLSTSIAPSIDVLSLSNAYGMSVFHHIASFCASDSYHSISHLKKSIKQFVPSLMCDQCQNLDANCLTPENCGSRLTEAEELHTKINDVLVLGSNSRDFCTTDTNRLVKCAVILVGHYIDIGERLMLKEIMDSSTIPSVGGFTPLHYAAFRGGLRLLQVFIKAGADVNATSEACINLNC
eukprot:GHVH01011460.1.p1 GENE.GHVH01011460.1~~GHVH01011460.1.p1  ORF type:complete len:998 (+),score=117.38 GHVH01011460.1:69-3062(+)